MMENKQENKMGTAFTENAQGASGAGQMMGGLMQPGVSMNGTTAGVLQGAGTGFGADGTAAGLLQPGVSMNGAAAGVLQPGVNMNGAAGERARKDREAGISMMRTLGPAILAYAVLFPFCLYENDRGIASVLFFAATIALLVRAMRLGAEKRNGVSDALPEAAASPASGEASSANVPDTREASETQATRSAAKKESIFIRVQLALIGLIGASVFLTDNSAIIFFDYMAVFFLVLSVLVCRFADTTGYTFLDYIAEMISSCFGAIGRLPAPFRDLAALRQEMTRGGNNRNREKQQVLWQVIAGVAAGLPIVAFLALLLSSADIVFRSILERMVSWIQYPDQVVAIVFMFFFALFGSYCGLRYFTGRQGGFHQAVHVKKPPVTGIVVSAMVSVLYFVFSMTQILYLFIGNMTLPYGYSYASYAREGFFQLLFVCMLNLVMVVIMTGAFESNRILRMLLALISVCTYIMIASSALRMTMYVRAYHLTFLRVFVFVALFTLAVLFVGVLLLVFRGDGGKTGTGFCFFRYAVATVGIIYAVFAFSHVDYFIARYNLTHLAEGQPEAEDDDYAGMRDGVDYYYLSGLSSDAAPAIISYAKAQGLSRDITEQTGETDDWYAYYLERHGQFRESGGVFHDPYEAESLRRFNLSHFVMRRMLAEY